MFTSCQSAVAIVSNNRVKLQASLETGQLTLILSAPLGTGDFVPVLERAGNNQPGAELRVELPEHDTLEVEQAGDRAFLIVTGTVDTTVGKASHIINIALREGNAWVDVSELLILDQHADEVGVDWFEAVWRFVGWNEPGEVFSPLLTPQPNDVIGRHVMRAPALAAQCGSRAAVLMNDIWSIGKEQAIPACMSLTREDSVPVFRTGLRPHQVRGHVYFEYISAPGHQARFHHSYSLYACVDAPPGTALDAANRQLWQRYGKRYLKAAPPLQMPYDEYARQVYPRMLDRLWAETNLNGKRVGAIRENRSYPNDVWMSPWFNQARSAYGLYLWGKWLENNEWVERALATRDLHLAAPQQRGLFPTVFVFGDTPERCRWVHSHHQGGGPGIYHLVDMSWTVYQLLRWHRDLTESAETLAFAQRYAQGVIALQRSDGSLPAYVDARSYEPVEHVDREQLLADLHNNPGGDPYVSYMLEHHWPTDRYIHSAEDAASLLMLAELIQALPDTSPERGPIMRAALRLAGWLEQWVFPESRWTDFEVYFSCSPKPLDFYDHRSGQWPQNTLCIHMAAAGFLALYEVRRERQYLELAHRAMDRLSLYQQVWDPPFLNFAGFGGYGVMNTDGEWSDGRQAQFADTHLDFYRALNETEHLERAKAACRAAFTTVYLPANSSVYPTGWCQQPRGIAAENHAHGGHDHLCGVSGFDWGIGSALSTAAYLKLHQIDIDPQIGE